MPAEEATLPLQSPQGMPDWLPPRASADERPGDTPAGEHPTGASPQEGGPAPSAADVGQSAESLSSQTAPSAEPRIASGVEASSGAEEHGEHGERRASAPEGAADEQEPVPEAWSEEALEAQEEESAEEQATGPVQPVEEVPVEPPQIPEFQWYIIKVGVNRESSAAEALRRRIERYGMQDYFGQIVVPTEDVVEFTKSGKKRTVRRKLFPGYIMVQMALTDETWFLVRETPGIGDFTGGAGRPTPMSPDEVRRIVKPPGEEGQLAPEVRVAIPFSVGDRVRVKEGYFQNFEGDVAAIDSTNGRVTVMINIFGRSTPVELQHWQMERI